MTSLLAARCPAVPAARQVGKAILLSILLTQSAAAQDRALTDVGHDALPEDGNEASSHAGTENDLERREEGFRDALKEAFPMTPEMVRTYRNIHDENERAVLERTFPSPIDDAELVSLEPGVKPPELLVSPGLASVVTFHDATGNPWPIAMHVVGNGNDFSIVRLGENSSSLSVSPLVRVGWTNLVVSLAGESSPVVLRILVDGNRAHFRKSIQLTKLGPEGRQDSTRAVPQVPRPGDDTMLAVMSATGIEDLAVVPVSGVDARAWTDGEHVYVRSRHPLLSPRWKSALSGPDGIRAYRLKPASALLFSVNGRMARADLELP